MPQFMRLMMPFVVLFTTLLSATILKADDARPNVLWITSEDNGPHLGCYGDEYAVTPNIDALAERGTIYLNCWSNAPVCAPARTCLISGMYPQSLGAQHMRSQVLLPAGFKMYPQYLREAGYYCTNNSKEDYNLTKPGEVWDESSRKAHWKNREDGQPFFAIFNHTISHESQIRNKIDDMDRIHDPAEVRVPAYHPDTPEVRKDWAQYYDRLTMMDARVGQNLKELEEAGLADETIIFYYGDHGSGMPRGKRSPYDSGLHVPLVVYIPPKFQKLATDDYGAGAETDRLVSFVDLPPTLLSLCGVKPPEHFQGHAFLGEFAKPKQDYIYGFRGRMDERYDMIRSVRDERYVYLRNYMPHRVYGQYIQYQFQTPTTRVWKEKFDAGELTDEQSHFWRTKPIEELYDLRADPDEVHNLAASPEHKETVERFRDALSEHIEEIVDLGFFPESYYHALAHDPESRDDQRYLKVREYQSYRPAQFDNLAFHALDPGQPDHIAGYIERLGTYAPYENLAIYWAATGVLCRGESAVARHRELLRNIVEGSVDGGGPSKDYEPAASARIVAAEALARYGNQEDVDLALPLLLKYANVEEQGVYVAMAALNAIDYLDEKAMPIKDEIAKLPRQAKSVPGRMRAYVGNLIGKTLSDLQ